MLKLKKEDFKEFIGSLREKYQVIAPVKQDIVRYKILKDGDEIIFETPFHPPKKFFLPAKETLFSFHKEKINAKLKVDKRIIFLPRCDANALLRIDKLYLDEFKDQNYSKRRENTIIIEYFCPETKDNCFCTSMGLIDCYDLRIFPEEDCFYVKVGSEKGKALLGGKSKDLFKPAEEKTFTRKCKRELNTEKATKMADFTESNVWQEEAENCLSCAACTSVCPNCCCFDVFDDVKIEDLTEGERKRKWDSCQLQSFTEVAGGHVFRKERDERLKHRLLHKFSYFKREHDMFMCVGCGRCMTACPTGIDMLKIIEKL